MPFGASVPDFRQRVAGVASSQKYVPPAARAAAAAASDKASQVQRRVRGLLNRMSDSNLPGIVSDVLQLTEQEGERTIADAVTSELLQASLQPASLLSVSSAAT